MARINLVSRQLSENKSERNPVSAHPRLLLKMTYFEMYLGFTHSRDLVEGRWLHVTSHENVFIFFFIFDAWPASGHYESTSRVPSAGWFLGVLRKITARHKNNNKKKSFFFFSLFLLTQTLYNHVQLTNDRNVMSNSSAGGANSKKVLVSFQFPLLHSRFLVFCPVEI